MMLRATPGACSRTAQQGAQELSALLRRMGMLLCQHSRSSLHLHFQVSVILKWAYKTVITRHGILGSQNTGEGSAAALTQGVYGTYLPRSVAGMPPIAFDGEWHCRVALHGVRGRAYGGTASLMMLSVGAKGAAVPELDSPREALSLNYRRPAPDRLRSSLDVPSSPSTPSSNPFAALVFTKSPRTAQLPLASLARPADLDSATLLPHQAGSQVQDLAAVHRSSTQLDNSSLQQPTKDDPAYGKDTQQPSASLQPPLSAQGAQNRSLEGPEAPRHDETATVATDTRPPPSVFAGVCKAPGHCPVLCMLRLHMNWQIVLVPNQL